MHTPLSLLVVVLISTLIIMFLNKLRRERELLRDSCIKNEELLAALTIVEEQLDSAIFELMGKPNERKRTQEEEEKYCEDNY